MLVSPFEKLGQGPSPMTSGSSRLPRSAHHAVCLGCGCLCDDVVAQIEGSKVVDVEGACALGRSWFISSPDRPDGPGARVDGQVVEIDQALDEAARRLGASRSPLFLGLAHLTNQGQAAALRLADRVGATVDASLGATEIFRSLAARRLGWTTASWGELRARADLMLFWGVAPQASHPRFWERFVEPSGRFVPAGRKGRLILAVDSQPNSLFPEADRTLLVPGDRQAEALSVLTRLASGRSIDPARFRDACEFDFAGLMPISDDLRSSRYGAIVVGPSLLSSPAPQATVEALIRLVRELNKTSRFVLSWFGGPMNPSGAESILNRQAGAPCSIDFSSGSPRFLPLDATAAHRLSSAETDFLIEFVGSSASDRKTSATLSSLRLGPGAALGDTLPGSIEISTSAPGFDTGGTVLRSDDIPLPLRPIRPAFRPSVEELLSSLVARLPVSLEAGS